jgi:hypothetical protein
MGFKMKGPSMHSGTAKHKSAVKSIQSVEARKQAIQDTDSINKSASPAKWGSLYKLGEEFMSKAKTKMDNKEKKAYGGTKTWSEGQKDSGGTLNEITRGQKAYEKKMKEKDPSWNKREDNTWKKTQNKINKHLGSKKVYDTIADKKTVEQTDSRGTNQVVKGIGRKDEKTLTEPQKQEERTKVSIEKDKIKKAKTDKKDATTTEGKNKAKNTRDKAQKEIGEIRSGRDNAKTGTVVSRWFGKQKAKRNQKQLDKRKKKEEKNSPTKYKKSSPAKCPLLAAAVPALVGGIASGIGKKATEKK